MKPRDYQIEADKAIDQAFEQHDSTLVVLPTGTGKTVLFAHVVQDRTKYGRVLVIAHRRELIDQAAQKIEAIMNGGVGIDMAEMRVHHEGMFRSRVVVASIQTLQNRAKNYPWSQFGTIIIDEAHHATADSYRKIVNAARQANPAIKVLGVTATPDRGDKQAMGLVFESVAYTMDLPDAINRGWLVPITQAVREVKGLDFSGLHTRGGDFVPSELAKILEDEEPAHRIVTGIIEEAAGKQTIVFCSSVKHAELTTAVLNRHRSDSAALITGTTPSDTRRDTITQFRAKSIQFLVNVAVATEGFDVPGIECVAVAQPTMSRARYTQMVGRGTRPLPGIVDGLDTAEERRMAIGLSAKPKCHVVDFTGNTGRHQLVTTADILGGNYSEEVRRKAAAKAKSGAVDMAKALEEERERELARIRRDQERRRNIVAKVEYHRTERDPFGGKLFTDAPGDDRRLKMMAMATEAQQWRLKQMGFKDPQRYTKAQASAIIAKANNRKGNMPSKQQMEMLYRMGYPTNISMLDAQVELAKIGARAWSQVERTG